ncbi:basic-leucine zipper transcription factor A isoform X2 [Athalia rosae]|uniref:basic-leucine zipper transcription factor A isoform X2 n=1 Tax=Athalia rosae TaxID=37344 RepID=UPI00203449BE|nr:basic-leucine zipper transcription factor A isoform X2 [Athalia rosae]
MKIATTLFLFVVVGFSVGDELGFRDSLSNLESNKRRSTQVRGNSIPIGTTANTGVSRNDVRQGVQAVKIVPPFKPLPPGGSRPMAQQPERQRLVVQQNSTAFRTVPAPSFAAMQEDSKKQQQRAQQEAFALQMLRQQQMQQQQALRDQQLQSQNRRVLQNAQSFGGTSPTAASQTAKKSSSNFMNGLPPFIAMPESSAQLTDRISHSPTVLEDSTNEVSKDDFYQLPIPSDEAAVSSVNQLTLRSISPAAANQASQSQQESNGYNNPQPSIPSPSMSSLSLVQGMEPSLKALAEASNVTLEALQTAILLRQQQLMQKHQQPTTTTSTSTTTSTTTSSPLRNKYNLAAPSKVMNAPREYYPVGYDKNFDDNFASRVELPDTSFYCGDQKHFPGLYADEDLGCMVFHVCALTDDGLIMKSFLCPESTLFDQTVLKCNWWFYVDCKSSKKLYDSNIPISKSYQLMKALAFFSAYKNHENGTTSSPVEPL